MRRPWSPPLHGSVRWAPPPPAAADAAAARADAAAGRRADAAAGRLAPAARARAKEVTRTADGLVVTVSLGGGGVAADGSASVGAHVRQ